MQSMLPVVLVHKNIPISRLAINHVQQCRIRILEWHLLNPRFNSLIGSQLQHHLDLLGAADSTAPDIDAVGNQSEGVDGGKITAIRRAATCSV